MQPVFHMVNLFLYIHMTYLSFPTFIPTSVQWRYSNLLLPYIVIAYVPTSMQRRYFDPVWLVHLSEAAQPGSLSIQQQLHYQYSLQCVKPKAFPHGKFLVIYRYDGIQHMICSSSAMNIELQSTQLQPTNLWVCKNMRWKMRTGLLSWIWYMFWRYIIILFCCSNI